MAATMDGSFFHKFLYLFILLAHLSCFSFSTKQISRTRKRKSSSLAPSSPSNPRKYLPSSFSNLRRFFSAGKCCRNITIQPQSRTPTLTSARNSQQSIVTMVPPEIHLPDDRQTSHILFSESDIAGDHAVFFPLRNNIFPCTTCGEIFQRVQLLEQHQSIKHAVSELFDGDAGKNIVRIIFKTGWIDPEKKPEIHRILKIHSSPKIVGRFEEYREFVMSKAAINGGDWRRDERCVADGNELLRFYCSTFMCDLGQNGNSGICGGQYCSICGIIRSGFSPKLEGISTLSTSSRAHVAVPEEVEEEFKFMNVKRAMLVCRVVAGRVGSYGEVAEKRDGGGYDSLLGSGGSGVHTRADEEELMVFNPRAVLPCFIIVYTV